MIFVIPVIILLFAYLYIENNRIVISELNYESEKVPEEFEGFKILQLSDLHSKVFSRDNLSLINMIEEVHPDIIVMTGDMINHDDSNYNAFIKMAEAASGLCNTYFIYGNNEERLEDHKKNYLIDELEKRGVYILNDKKVSIERGKSEIVLYGITMKLSYYKPYKGIHHINIRLTEKEISDKLGAPSSEKVNILLAHNPVYFESYVHWGADLILTGHIHGGIIRLPFLGGLLSPDRSFFPKYFRGKYKYGRGEMVVNCGLGSKKLLPRVFNPPELTVINLSKEKNNDN